MITTGRRVDAGWPGARNGLGARAAGLGAALAVLASAALPLAAAGTAAKASAGPPATKLVAVRSERDGRRQVVRLESDGRPGGTVEKRAAPLRLVVSLPGLRNTVAVGSIAANGPFVKKIAVGRTSRGGKGGVEVVLSLVSPAEFEVRRDANGLSIVLSEEAARAADAAGAGTARPPSPAAVGPRISLAEAIRRTLASATRLRLARESYLASRGSLQQASGQFDPSVTFSPSFQRGLNATLSSAPPSGSAVTSLLLAPPLSGLAEGLAARSAGARSAAAGLSWSQFPAARTGAPGEDPLTVPGTELLPLTDEVDSFTMDLALPFRFRNGVVASPFLSTQAAQDRTESGVPTRFQVDAGLRVDWPLGKGGGTASAGAAERAARLGSEAALHLVAQAASQSVLDTVVAYWTLAAAQERLALLERSAEQQRTIERLSVALVQADEIPRSELDRIRARAADAETSAAQGRQLLVAARVALAVAMGTVVADLDDAPLAADALPPSPPAAELEKSPIGRLAALASRRRADLAAARKQRDAADALWNAARIDLRPRVDLSLQASYGAVREDASRNATSFAGVWDTMTGRWAGPSFALSLRFELPFGNRTYRGQFVQAGAAREQADISALDISRTAASRTAELSESVLRSAAEVSAREVSARENDRTVSAAFEQFRAGELSLVDAIVTERNQTLAGLDLVASRQLLATRVAQLRFEAGALVPYALEADGVAFGEAAPVGLSFTE